MRKRGMVRVSEVGGDGKYIRLVAMVEDRFFFVSYRSFEARSLETVRLRTVLVRLMGLLSGAKRFRQVEVCEDRCRGVLATVGDLDLRSFKHSEPQASASASGPGVRASASPGVPSESRFRDLGGGANRPSAGGLPCRECDIGIHRQARRPCP